MIVTLNEITKQGTNWLVVDQKMIDLLNQSRFKKEELIIHIPEEYVHNNQVPYSTSIAMLADEVWIVDQKGGKRPLKIR